MELNPRYLSQILLSGLNALDNQLEKINCMNIFPVPDGDTGTNMSCTLAPIRSVSSDSCSLGDYVSEISGCVICASRGNSGVILSSFLKGFAAATEEGFTVETLVSGFRRGVQSAYRSLMNPTEGTMLSVMSACAETAEQGLARQMSLLPLFDAIVQAAEEALKRTPEQLDVLRLAKVLDSGAYGFCCLLHGICEALHGRPIALENTAVLSYAKADFAASADFSAFSGEDITFAYCTECIVEKSEYYRGDGKAAALQDVLARIGDSAAVIDSTKILKLHVHTNSPGVVIEEVLHYGELIEVKVENMRRQHSDLTMRQEPPAAPRVVHPTKAYGFIAVAAGDGICQRFMDLGIDRLVSGGQSMNPSTKELQCAMEESEGETVFVLANNKNVIPAAMQAAELCQSRKVYVVPTRSSAEGMVAMLGFDPALEGEKNFERMTALSKNVNTVEVTKAVRDSEGDIPVKSGSYVAILDDVLTAVGSSEEACLSAMTDTFSDAAFLTVYYGMGKTEEQGECVVQCLQKLAPDAEIYLLDGGQPIYEYLISVEK